MIRDALISLFVMCIATASVVVIAGCLSEPTFVTECTRCGAPLHNPDHTHAHFMACDGEWEGGPWKCR